MPHNIFKTGGKSVQYCSKICSKCASRNKDKCRHVLMRQEIYMFSKQAESMSNIVRKYAKNTPEYIFKTGGKNIENIFKVRLNIFQNRR